MKNTKGCRLGQGKSWMGQAEGSTLQVCQLTELKQTKEWERYPDRFRRLYETFLLENLGKYCRNGQQAKHSQRSRFSFKKTVNRRILHVRRWLSHKRPCSQGVASLSRKVQPPSIKTVQLSQRSQPPARQWRENQSPMPSAGLPQKVTVNHTGHQPHRFGELATYGGSGSPDWKVK